MLTDEQEAFLISFIERESERLTFEARTATENVARRAKAEEREAFVAAKEAEAAAAIADALSAYDADHP